LKRFRLAVRGISLLFANYLQQEIEAVFLEAMFSAFERSKEPTDLDIASALSGFVPLSRLMAEQIAALKQWSINRARPATSHSAASESTTRKLGV
jgi:hypothetical protein